MITFNHTKDGYEFINNEKPIAIGCYSKLGFELYELDGSNTVHGNGMLAMSYVREKYTPEYYTSHVSNVLPVETEDNTAKIRKYSGHKSLKGVWPLASEVL